ncbi:endonuclease domain-containing protein [Caulobacter sp. SLTY]|uniref:endonuclease domain-containing protein n=1 Tax=Caulobacter sp. SLTY TaxID=2683262 RepID=UPI001F112887|nr:endonuclease domain-containing protein [Caulobacter sp. SLTY]
MPEGLLWQHLRGRQLEGLKFRRQHPMGPYVLDFFCPALGLAVEIDSQWHYGPGREEHDAIRDTWLKRRGVTVLRLPAQLVLSDMSSTIDTILGSIADRAGKP